MGAEVCDAPDSRGAHSGFWTGRPFLGWPQVRPKLWLRRRHPRRDPADRPNPVSGEGDMNPSCIVLPLILMCLAFNGLTMQPPAKQAGNLIFFILGIVLMVLCFVPLGLHPLH